VDNRGAGSAGAGVGSSMKVAPSLSNGTSLDPLSLWRRAQSTTRLLPRLALASNHPCDCCNPNHTYNSCLQWLPWVQRRKY